MHQKNYMQMSLVIIHIVVSHAKNIMSSKSWIEDYRGRVDIGVPPRSVCTEFSIETHKNGVIQIEGQLFDDELYDSMESSSLFRSRRKLTVRNKGERQVGEWVSDLIIVPKNVTHWLPNVRVDIILLDKIMDEDTNFIGLLESPINDGYLDLSSSLCKMKKNCSVSYEFALCGNEGRNDMLSVGSMKIHINFEHGMDSSIELNARVIDPYLFMVVVRSLKIGVNSLANCKELNVQGAIFDNTLPGIYLPLKIFQRLVKVIHDYAIKKKFPAKMKIWEKRNYVCFNAPVQWKFIPTMRLQLFSAENETVEIAYSGQSLVKRYYRINDRKRTFCYIFAVRKNDDERLIFGRTAFEGVRVIFNRTGRAVSFLENSDCGPRVKLRKVTETSEEMSLCLQKELRSGTTNIDTYWVWIMITAIAVSILAFLLSIPKSIQRATHNPLTIHVFITQSELAETNGDCQGGCQNTTE